jgi:hypothetical protein
MTAVAPALTGTQIDPDDPAGLCEGHSLIHKPEVFLPLLDLRSMAPALALLAVIDGHRIP